MPPGRICSFSPSSDSSNKEAALKVISFAAHAASPDFLQQVLEPHRGEKHAIVLQDFPDPDAISCGYAHQLISAQWDISADLLYEGRVSHQQNLALVQLLGIPLVRADDAPPLESYQASIFVDNQGSTSALTKKLSAAGVKPLLVVDHHEDQHTLNAEFTDLRDVGAAATIYTDYLAQGALELDRANPVHVALATALMHGLMTDTNYFTRAREPDFQAAQFLSRFYNAELLEKIVNQSRSKQLMDLIHRALENRQIQNGFSISGIGYVTANERDAIPQAANFLVTEENVHTAIVYGLVIKDDGAESLIGSLRTIKSSLSPDQFLKDTLGKSESGTYYGGGRRDAGGFDIPLGFLSDSGDSSEDFRGLKWLVFDAQMKNKLSKSIGGGKLTKK
jgi:nanoRNase/pAp phosphatase (c-di-AMP/oligoRNAs hydrolase)